MDTFPTPQIPTRNGHRKDFSRIRTSLPIPNLIDVQRRSYERFLQMNLLPEERANQGLQAVFTGIFPFSDFRETCSLDFVKYSIGDWQCKCGELKGLEYLRMTCTNCGAKIMTDHPHEETVTCTECGFVNKNRVTKCDICGNPVDLQLKYSISDCQERGMTFAVPLKVTFRLFVYDRDPETGTRMMRDAKEEEVYFGDIPLMTDNGTFIINGTERVIVSQLHRSPGVFFTKEGPRSYLSKIIPYRGSWVEFEYDQKDVLSVRIDRKRKFHGTVFLRALGLESDESILRQFYTPVGLTSEGGGKFNLHVTPKVLDPERLKDRQSRGRRETYPIFAGITLSREQIGKLDTGQTIAFEVGQEDLERAFFIADVVDLDTGEVLFEANELVPEDIEERLDNRSSTPVQVFFPDWELVGATLSQHPGQGHDPQLQGGADRDLPAHAPGRSADPGERTVAVLRHVLRRQALRLLARRPLQVQHQARHRGAGRPEDPLGGRLLPRHRVPAAFAEGRRPRRRHRQPRQPPRARGGRAAGEPVPHRPRAHGAGDQGEDVRPPGHRLGDAARPDQLQAGHRGDQGVLRLVAAVAVHGPDEPALGGHPQAAALGPRTGRSLP